MTLHLASRILETLEQNGYEAYYVGGCVRDWLLSRPVHDIDICTNAHPGDVIRLFPDHVPTGLKHGTVSVRIDGQFFEVTTYRTEGKYEDYRRPAEVQFVSELKLDLARRDFTMNAMAMNRVKELQDPFGGREDLAKKLVRAVGEPLERFREDALRLLRCVRFAAQLGFSIEPHTLAAMKKTAPLLAHIAVERVREELNKMLASESPHIGCAIINETGLCGYSPVLQRLFRDGAAESWRVVHVQSLPQKWSLLLYAARFPAEESKAVCQLLKMSKRETEAIVGFVELLHRLQPSWDAPEPVEWGQLLLDAGWDTCEKLAGILRGCWWNQQAQTQSVIQTLGETYQAMPVKTIKELAVTGLDLQVALQKKAGEWIVHVLRALLVQTALHGLPNTPEALIEAARKEVAQYEH